MRGERLIPSSFRGEATRSVHDFAVCEGERVDVSLEHAVTLNRIRQAPSNKNFC